jgi:hypothetical protein
LADRKYLLVQARSAVNHIFTDSEMTPDDKFEALEKVIEDCEMYLVAVDQGTEDEVDMPDPSLQLGDGERDGERERRDALEATEEGRREDG